MFQHTNGDARRVMMSVVSTGTHRRAPTDKHEAIFFLFPHSVTTCVLTCYVNTMIKEQEAKSSSTRMKHTVLKIEHECSSCRSMINIMPFRSGPTIDFKRGITVQFLGFNQGMEAGFQNSAHWTFKWCECAKTFEKSHQKNVVKGKGNFLWTQRQPSEAI